MNSNITGSPQSPSAPQSGANGGSPIPSGILDRAMFSQVVAQMDEGEPAADQTSPAADAQSAPEAPAPTAEQDSTGEENLQPEETPTEGTEEVPEESETENVLSQSNEDAELAEALQGLDEGARRKLIEIAKSVKEGDETIGGVKRIHQLTSELNKLKTKLEEMEATPPAPQPVAETGNLPKAVADIKTLKDVETRMDDAEKSVRAIEDFLDENPQGGQIGGQEFTRQEMIARKRQFQDELRALPKRAQQIQRSEAIQAARKEATVKIRQDFPVLNDAEHPETKLVRELIRDPKFADVPNAEYIALAIARGHQSLQADIAKRSGKAPITAARPPVKPAGKVPLGKPHTAAAGLPARPAAGPSVKAALDRVKKEGSRDSLAELLSSTGF